MPRAKLTTIIAACLLWSQSSLAATVEIDGDAPRESISITIEDARVDAVLEHLRKRYGFEVAGLENVARGDAVTMTISGSLRSVLGRLLRNRNYIVVRSTSSASGIAKITILNSAYGSAPPKGTPTYGSDNEELMQARSGDSTTW
jgi:hypothetical protein